MYIANKYPDSIDMKEEIAWLIATLACDKELSERLNSLDVCLLIIRLLNEKLISLDLVNDSSYLEALTSVSIHQLIPYIYCNILFFFNIIIIIIRLFVIFAVIVIQINQYWEMKVV